MKCILHMPFSALKGAQGEARKVGSGPARQVTLDQAGTGNGARGQHA